MQQTLLTKAVLIVALSISAAGLAHAAPPSNASSAPASTASGDEAEGSLVGRDVFSQDQTLVGQVERVASKDGRVQSIFIRTGGFLGFGARLVAISEGQFHMRGRNVQLQLTSEDVQKLPAVKASS